jgi:hypothetical protein
MIQIKRCSVMSVMETEINELINDKRIQHLTFPTFRYTVLLNKYVIRYINCSKVFFINTYIYDQVYLYKVHVHLIELNSGTYERQWSTQGGRDLGKVIA